MVQPIRLEDGKVDETLATDGDPPRTKEKFDQLFAGMPSLNEILSRETVAQESARDGAEQTLIQWPTSDNLEELPMIHGLNLKSEVLNKSISKLRVT